MPRAAKRQKRSTSLSSQDTLPCMAPSPTPSQCTVTARNTNDPVLGVPLKGVASEELVELQSPCVLAWAPALVFLWQANARSAHPVTMQPLEPAEEEAVLRAALKASSGSTAGPPHFLLFRMVATSPAPAEKEAALRAHLASLLVQRPAIASCRLPTLLADQLESIREAILHECSLDAVQEVQRSVQSLSMTWLWLYDALWGQLVRLDAPLALSRMLHGAVPAFREALAQAWGYHPLVLAPIVRHMMFLEEYVCRAALGSLDTAGPWRYESFAATLYRPVPHARGQHRTGFAEWPLGVRSEVFVVPTCSANLMAYVEAQLEESPLVDAHVAPPAPEALPTTAAAAAAVASGTSRHLLATSSSILALLQQELGGDDLLSGVQLFNNARMYHIHRGGASAAMSLGQIVGMQPASSESFDLLEDHVDDSHVQGIYNHYIVQPASQPQAMEDEHDVEDEDASLDSEDEDDDVIY
jgi:hypothetical protein